MGKILAWIMDFLLNRCFRVKVNGALSEPIHLISEVPQGSVIGLELFKLYNNDLPRAFNVSCLLYADDLKLLAHYSSPEGPSVLQSALDTLYGWSLSWQLPINLQKCSLPPLTTRDSPPTYQIGGSVIRPVTSERDLGIKVASDLKSQLDTTKKVAAASRLLGAIRRSFSRMTPLIFKTLFCSHVRPILEFGQQANFPLTKRESELLERVQRRGSKSVLGFNHLSYADRLQQLHLFSLAYRRRRGDLIYARRILNGEHGADLQEFFTFNNDGPTRGHAWKLFKPRRHRLRPTLTLSTRVVNDWNRLPSSVAEAPTESGFKHGIDRFFLQQSDME